MRRQRGTNCQNGLYVFADGKSYVDLQRADLDGCNLRILAFCVTSNHLHWIIVPGTEDSLATLFRRVCPA